MMSMKGTTHTWIPGVRSIASGLGHVLLLVVVAVSSLAVSVLAVSASVVSAVSAPVVPALFVFGDSLADAGNNNGVRTLAKANHPPYGLTYPGHLPTGRFVDGFNAFDYFALKLGLPLVPIYANNSTQGIKLLQGVNFASAASGIMGYTGLNFGKVFPLEVQVEQFTKVKEEIEALIGREATSELLSKSLFVVVSGSNDWVNTYFFPGSPLPKLYTVPQYRDLLLEKFFSQIQSLYNAGARRVAVAGLGALGCCPSQLRGYKSENGTCIGWLNDLAMDFNDHLRPQLFNLANTLPNATFAYQNLFTPFLDAVNNPARFGFTKTHQACCGIGKYGGFLNCFQGFPVCKDVYNHLFWDAYHPSSKFCKQLIEILWNNGPPYSYPKSGKELLL